MEILKEFEKQVIKLLITNIFSAEQLDEIIQHADFKGYEYTGSGYFLKLYHPKLPKERIVYSEPTIIGKADGVECGFVIFIDNHELTLECHSWSEINVSDEFRNKVVEIRINELITGNF